MPLLFDPDTILSEYVELECRDLDEGELPPTPGVCHRETVIDAQGDSVTAEYCTEGDPFDPNDFPIIQEIVDIIYTVPIPPVAIQPPANPVIPGPPPFDPFDDYPVPPGTPDGDSDVSTSDEVTSIVVWPTSEPSEETDLGVQTYEDGYVEATVIIP